MLGERQYWSLQDHVYWDNDDLNGDEIFALIVTRQQRKGSKSTGRKRLWQSGTIRNHQGAERSPMI